MKVLARLGLVLVFGLVSAGCSIVIQKRLSSDVEKINQLEKELQEKENALKIQKTELEELKKIKALLEQRLKEEIANKEVKLDLTNRGVVITLTSDILFDSGKADIKPEAYPILDKVAEILKYKIADRNVGVEGHTDNQPIKYSHWKSNWELSTARAVNVVHYLIKKGVPPQRLTAIGYGEYRPIADNSTEEGRRKNRRVEIVILPELRKVSVEQTPIEGNNVVKGEDLELK